MSNAKLISMMRNERAVVVTATADRPYRKPVTSVTINGKQVPVLRSYYR